MYQGRVANRAFWLLATGCVLLALSGCATAHARSAAEAPALDMPPPPPHTIEAAETEPPPQAAAPDEPSRRVAPPPTTTTTNTTTRRAPAPRTEPKDPPKPEPLPTPTPTPEPPKPEAAKQPITQQTAPTDAQAKEDQQIRALLAKASDDLNRTDYRRLSPVARTQYDTAKRFVTQAQNALQAKNLVLARAVADKAAALAGQLPGK